MKIARHNYRLRLILASLAIVVMLIAMFLTFHPDRPLWIRNEEFSVRTADGVTLSGTLSVPRWSEPIGAVVVVHGSGPLAREHLRGDVRSLVANGFAVVHYDKRGAGQSQGEYMPSASNPMTRIVDVLADDAVAMMTKLQTRFKDESIEYGFFGASQAGWIIPLAATRCSAQPSFMIIISGTPASTGVEGFYSQLTGDGTGDALQPDMNEVKRQTLAFDGDPGFDPMPFWAELNRPTLWLLGDADRSVPTFASLDILEKHIGSGHPEHHVIRYQNCGHDLRDIVTGEPSSIWPDILEWYRNRRESSLPSAGSELSGDQPGTL